MISLFFGFKMLKQTVNALCYDLSINISKHFGNFEKNPENPHKSGKFVQDFIPGNFSNDY